MEAKTDTVAYLQRIVHLKTQAVDLLIKEIEELKSERPFVVFIDTRKGQNEE